MAAAGVLAADDVVCEALEEEEDRMGEVWQKMVECLRIELHARD